MGVPPFALFAKGGTRCSPIHLCNNRALKIPAYYRFQGPAREPPLHALTAVLRPRETSMKMSEITGRSFLSEPLKAVATPQFANVFDRVRNIRTVPTYPHKGPHGLPTSFQLAEKALTGRLPHQLRNACPLTARSLMQSIPEIVIEVKLDSFHEVYSSPEARKSNRPQVLFSL